MILYALLFKNLKKMKMIEYLKDTIFNKNKFL